jgi:hypothetical protein
MTVEIQSVDAYLGKEPFEGTITFKTVSGAIFEHLAMARTSLKVK